MTFWKASVIICTRNRSLLLPNLIGQLRVQDYPADAFEIIVVDNASTDNTREVIEKLIDEPGVKVRYIAESRTGITFARNRGAKEAFTNILAYLDDDCSIDPGWLSHLIHGFDLQDDVMVVGGRVLLEYDNQKIPSWLGIKSERWLSAYDFPGLQPRLLENPEYICEGNMALTHHAWEIAGGFLGMDRFNNPHVASNESIFFLEQVKRKNGKVAFVPGATVHHHAIVPTKMFLLKRAFWNGVSKGILEYLLYRRIWVTEILRVLINTAASIIFLFISLFFLIMFNEAEAMYNFLRAVRRIGLILSELHMVGDWRQVKLWVSESGKV